MSELVRKLCFVAFLSLCTSVAQAKVTVFVNQHAFDFESSPRLNEVLAPVAESNDWYWPASAAYDLNDPTAETLKKETMDLILSELKTLSSNDSDYQALDNLYRQVASWSVGTRKLVSVSYNRARVFPAHNPMFQPGKYLIRLFSRPEGFHVAGAVKVPGVYKHQNDVTISSVTSGITLSPKADNSEVWVILPSGDIRVEGKAYWNKGFSQLMPGSQLYFPLKESLFSRSTTLINERVAQLAVHRILP